VQQEVVSTIAASKHSLGFQQRATEQQCATVKGTLGTGLQDKQQIAPAITRHTKEFAQSAIRNGLNAAVVTHLLLLICILRSHVWHTLSACAASK
jgi:hypothetical protein